MIIGGIIIVRIYCHKKFYMHINHPKDESKGVSLIN
jgi:hypothetical protein